MHILSQMKENTFNDERHTHLESLSGVLSSVLVQGRDGDDLKFKLSNCLYYYSKNILVTFQLLKYIGQELMFFMLILGLILIKGIKNVINIALSCTWY